MPCLCTVDSFPWMPTNTLSKGINSTTDNCRHNDHNGIINKRRVCRAFALLTVSLGRPLQLKTWVVGLRVTQNGLCQAEVDH